jgi:hypothetical protein
MGPTTYYDIQCKTALNRVQHMGFAWSLNPYQGCFHSCHYCFARAHAKLADRDPGEGFSARVGVKVNVADVLRSELASPRWRRETVAFGTATDPYQPVEGQRRLTRRCLTVAAAAQAGACFLFASVAYLKPGTKEHFFAFLERGYPHLVGRYQHLDQGAHAPPPLKASLQRQVLVLKQRWQLRDRRSWRAEPPPEP